MSFVDDYSRTTWLYLLKERSKVPIVFESFFNEIKNQFDVFIQILQSDNALEYYHSNLTNFVRKMKLYIKLLALILHNKME